MFVPVTFFGSFLVVRLVSNGTVSEYLTSGNVLVNDYSFHDNKPNNKQLNYYKIINNVKKQ